MCFFVFRLNRAKESHAPLGWGVRPCAQIWCRLGAVFGVECRPGYRDMPLYAAICRSLERKSSIFLGFVLSCQRGGRRFAAELCSASAKRAKPASEPGLVLQGMERPDQSCDRAFLVRVMVGGLLGPLPPPAHPQQRHQAAQPRGQREGSGSNTMSAPSIEDTERSARATSPWVSVM